MMTRSEPSELFCRNWSTRSSRQPAKLASASRSRWLAFQPNCRRRATCQMEAKTEANTQIVKQLREKTNAGLVDAERAIYEAQVKGKPANVVDKIVAGKLDKFFSTVCLLEQGFIKNPDQTVKELVATKIAELGENIVIRRFTRYSVGEPVSNDS